MGKQIAFTVCLALTDEPNLLSKLLSQLYALHNMVATKFCDIFASLVPRPSARPPVRRKEGLVIRVQTFLSMRNFGGNSLIGIILCTGVPDHKYLALLIPTLQPYLAHFLK